ncbi:MAG TPA: excinuclease ABC subunit UvrB, partial [Thermoanaerobacterales bacterium]|nr:excinuclease ABC subunit UvrB [Thermoanaerobacterales bacterium]
QYQRNDIDFSRNKFRVRGDVIEVYPSSYTEKAIRIELFGDEIEKIREIDTLTGEVLGDRVHISIFPASHYATPKDKMDKAIIRIEKELEEHLKKLQNQDKLLEAQRLEQRTKYDIEMMREMGYCTGIENYSRHLSGRKEGEPPYTLIDYFPEDFLIIVDESHVTIPQIRAMYAGDRSRKKTLVDFGFRLPSALDNRPLTFQEFEERINQIVFVSATPGPYELEKNQQIVEQIIRPTGLLDPKIVVKPVKGQIDDLFAEINDRVKKKQRVLITTLTKRMSEDLTDYLKDMNVKVTYLHSEIHTLERMEILRDLRVGKYDVLVGINLLREGLDLPEVSLIAILDADKEGFLRSETSLIQTIGRAARNVDGKVIMYADKITNSMNRAISETNRRRKIQMEYNKKHGIVPKSIKKDIHDVIEATKTASVASSLLVAEESVGYNIFDIGDIVKLPGDERKKLIGVLEKDMELAAKKLEFEKAAMLRDLIIELKGDIGKSKAKRLG